MSKTMEQAPINVGPPAARGNPVIQGQKDDKNQKVGEIGFKEVGIVLGIFLVIVGIVGYGFFSQQGNAGSEKTASPVVGAPNSPKTEESQPSPSALAQPVQAPQSFAALAESTPMPTEVKPASTPTEVIHADIYFDFGQSRLRADATATLQQHAHILKKDGNWAVLIQGYADQQGPAGYNKVLALRRGEAVKQFLSELGVPESAMKVVSLGKESTICDDHSRTCQRLNRRVHLELVKLESPLASMAPSLPASPRHESEASPAIEEETHPSQSADPLTMTLDEPGRKESLMTSPEPR